MGTTGCKAGVFGLDGACRAQAYREYDMLHPQPGWSELDSADVWRKAKAVLAEVAARAAGDPVTALAISAFGEAFVPVTKGRELLDASILCLDDRGREHADRLAAAFTPEKFYAINPNLPGPQFTLPKLLWLREHRLAVFERADYFLLWSDCLAFLLGAEPVTNNSHANRTLLFDLERNAWSEPLLAWSGLPRAKLGRVVAGGARIGTVSDALAAELGLPRGVQVIAGGHDQCCNALGCGAVAAGQAVYGMGSFDCITPVFGKPAVPDLMRRAGLNIEHHVVPTLFVAFLFNQSGLLVKWFRDTFATDTVPPPGLDIYTLLERELPAEPTRLLVLPHFTPPLFPRHLPDTSGVIAGLKSETRRGEILKAIRECTALYFVDSLAGLQSAGITLTGFIASGGGARSDAGLQIRADVFGLPVVRPRLTEAGVLGAAMLAGLGTGQFSSPAEAAEVCVRHERVFEPDAARHVIYREKHAIYRQLFPALQPVLNRL